MIHTDKSRPDLSKELADATHEYVGADDALKHFRLTRRFVNAESEAERTKLEDAFSAAEKKLAEAKRALLEYDQ